ncbi:unnamed protein product [Strongylus vulgaris]|uniref:Uncharacterized protein n=1 Tax=Strongylus vulgaris TaxID=40348 RepID=A0A3P7JE45_STRVU|nr:unnamed protein product [Strongylus vulgaris]
MDIEELKFYRGTALNMTNSLKLVKPSWYINASVASFGLARLAFLGCMRKFRIRN